MLFRAGSSSANSAEYCFRFGGRVLSPAAGAGTTARGTGACSRAPLLDGALSSKPPPTANGRARFLFAEPRPLPEAPSPAFPLLLLTGRGSSTQWHTQTRTKRSPILEKLSPSKPYVEISNEDASALGVKHDEWVQVSSQRGEMAARAFVTRSVSPGQVFMPMHDESVNRLTFAAFDPFSRQPSYKACAVRITKANSDP